MWNYFSCLPDEFCSSSWRYFYLKASPEKKEILKKGFSPQLRQSSSFPRVLLLLCHEIILCLSHFLLSLSISHSLTLYHSLSLLPTLSLYRLEANIDFNHTSSSLQWFFSNSTFCAFSLTSLCRIKAPFFKTFLPTYVGR